MTVYFAQPNITLAEYRQVEFPKPDVAHNGSDTGIRIESDADVGVTVQIRRDDGNLDQSPPPVIWHGKTSNHLIQVDVVGALTSMFSNPKATKNVTTVVLTFQGLTSPNIPCLLREQ